MKQKSDVFTADMFGKNPVGRPRKPDAKTPAQRMRDYRQRQRELSYKLPVSVTRDEN
jgi:hypothetical protein